MQLLSVNISQKRTQQKGYELEKTEPGDLLHRRAKVLRESWLF